jgi:hypothetical protein
LKRIYIAGPMRGYPQFNFPAFDAARDAWAARGWDVVSPADMDRQLDGLNEATPTPDTNHSFAHYMRRDISVLLTVDAVAFLPGWEASTGANVEKVVAQALALELYDALTYEPLASERVRAVHCMIGPLESKLESFAIPEFYHSI